MSDRKVLMDLKKLKKYFPVRRGVYIKALEDVSFSIYEGEKFGVVGESDAGVSPADRHSDDDDEHSPENGVLNESRRGADPCVVEHLAGTAGGLHDDPYRGEQRQPQDDCGDRAGR